MTNNQDTATFDAALHKEDNGLTVIEGNDYVQHERIAPQSHTCCGCCCDTRRAVIVVNIISISFAALAVLSISLLTNDQYAAQLDDDEVKAALGEIDGAAVGVTIGIAILGMVCNACGIFGAYKYHKITIAIAALWYFAECIRSCVFFDFAGVVMAAFFMYPHVIFYQEVSKGIMSPASYPQEKQCCNCCV